MTQPDREELAGPLSVEARAEAWSDSAEIVRMVDGMTEVFAKWATPDLLSRFRQQVAAVIQQAFIEGHADAAALRQSPSVEKVHDAILTRLYGPCDQISDDRDAAIFDAARAVDRLYRGSKE